MNLDFLSYVIPILGSSLSVLLSVCSLFSAKKQFKDISQATLTIKKAKQYRNNAKLNREIMRHTLQDRLAKLDLQEKEIEKLQLELEEVNKLILQFEELAKQESDTKESDTKESDTDEQQIVLLKQISNLLVKSAIPKIEAIGTPREKS